MKTQTYRKRYQYNTQNKVLSSLHFVDLIGRRKFQLFFSVHTTSKADDKKRCKISVLHKSINLLEISPVILFGLFEKKMIFWYCIDNKAHCDNRTYILKDANAEDGTCK